MSRRGVSMILFAVGIAAFCLLCALAVDVGYLYYHQSRLQTVADMAALSALGTCSTAQSTAAQQTAINATIAKVILTNYGSAADAPAFTTTFTTTQTNTQNPAQVDTVTLDVSQTVSTAFWAMKGPAHVSIGARARVARIYETGRATLANGLCLGFFGSSSFTLTGRFGRYDSYDSRNGTYNPVNASGTGNAFDTTYDHGALNVMTNGAFAYSTNNNQANFYGNIRAVGNINIRRNTFIRGDVRTNGAYTTNGAVVTGTIGNPDNTFGAVPAMQRPQLPSASVSEYDNGNINASTFSAAVQAAIRNGDLNTGAAGSIAIPAGGRYLFTRFRATGNNTRIVITGSTSVDYPTRIWFTGTTNANMVMQGGLSQSTATEDATKLIILGTNTAGSIAITPRTFTLLQPPNTANTYAQVYAPDLDVTVSMDATTGTQFLGSIVGANVELDDGGVTGQSFVYDEALGCTLNVSPTGSGGGTATPEGMSTRVHLIE